MNKDKNSKEHFLLLRNYQRSKIVFKTTQHIKISSFKTSIVQKRFPMSPNHHVPIFQFEYLYFVLAVGRNGQTKIIHTSGTLLENISKHLKTYF